jgi:hypothetical protein
VLWSTLSVKAKGTPSILTSALFNQAWVEIVAGMLQSALPIFPTGIVTLSDTLNGQTTTLGSYAVTREQINGLFPLVLRRPPPADTHRMLPVGVVFDCEEVTVTVHPTAETSTLAG